MDGSYNKETGEYACGVLLIRDGLTETYSKSFHDPELATMHNVAGEIEGARLLMELCVQKGIGHVDLYYDYAGIECWCTGAWKTNKEGTRAYRAYYESLKGILNVSFHKVTGHSGDKYNDIADLLAKRPLGLLTDKEEAKLQRILEELEGGSGKEESCKEKEQADIVIAEVLPEDAETLVEIYAPYVERTAVSFEYEVPTVPEFRGRIEHTLKAGFPYYKALLGDRIVGYAYAGPFQERAAYRYCAELTVYVDEEYKRRGIGSALYASLESFLRKKGFTNLYARVAMPEKEDEYLNRDSLRFHESEGFRLVGTHHFCGCKFDRYYHMVWMEKILGS